MHQLLTEKNWSRDTSVVEASQLTGQQAARLVQVSPSPSSSPLLA